MYNRCKSKILRIGPSLNFHSVIKNGLPLLILGSSAVFIKKEKLLTAVCSTVAKLGAIRLIHYLKNKIISQNNLGIVNKKTVIQESEGIPDDLILKVLQKTVIVSTSATLTSVGLLAYNYGEENSSNIICISAKAVIFLSLYTLFSNLFDIDPSKLFVPMQKLHERQNIGKITLDPSMEPKPKPVVESEKSRKDSVKEKKNEEKVPKEEDKEKEKEKDKENPAA